jgi:tetratricopeptide (TPR) repeat protein
MILRLSKIFLLGLLMTASVSAEDKLSKDQVIAIFNQANDAFRQANSIVDNTQKAGQLYEKAILGYEKIINDAKFANPKLYYNLANSYLLQDEIGRAILNYRRAQKLDKSDSNIQKNLAFARTRRVDKVEIKTERQVLQTLIFWHYDFSLLTKFVITCVSLTVFCVTLSAIIWFGRRGLLTFFAAASAIVLICFLSSLVIENYNDTTKFSGVIIAPEAVAYQGDGLNYPQSFKAPLHAGTEFDLIEQRPGWFHIKLADDSEGWIPRSCAELI